MLCLWLCLSHNLNPSRIHHLSGVLHELIYFSSCLSCFTYLVKPVWTCLKWLISHNLQTLCHRTGIALVCKISCSNGIFFMVLVVFAHFIMSYSLISCMVASMALCGDQWNVSRLIYSLPHLGSLLVIFPPVLTSVRSVISVLPFTVALVALVAAW